MEMQVYINASETQVLTLWQSEVGNDEKLTGYIFTNNMKT